MYFLLTLSLPECLRGFCKVTLTFESMDKILWCDHSNESSLPVLSHYDIFKKKIKFGTLVEICLWPHLAVKGLTEQRLFKAIRLIFKRFSHGLNCKTREKINTALHSQGHGSPPNNFLRITETHGWTRKRWTLNIEHWSSKRTFARKKRETS